MQRAWRSWCNRLCNHGVTGKLGVNKWTKTQRGQAANTLLGFRQLKTSAGLGLGLGHDYGILPHVSFSYFPGILDLGV